MPVRVGLPGGNPTLDGAPLDVDQVLVVGALGLVVVRGGEGAALILLQELGVAARVVHGGLAGLRLRVAAGHDHDAVVVPRCVDGLLDGAEPAPIGQLTVDVEERPGVATGELVLRQARTQAVAAVVRAVDGPPGLRERVGLADHAHLARPRPGDGGRQRARVGDLSARGRGDGSVGGGIGPVRRALQMRDRDGGDDHGGGDCHPGRPPKARAAVLGDVRSSQGLSPRPFDRWCPPWTEGRLARARGRADRARRT